MAVLELVGIEKRFGGVRALSGASLSADAGQIVGLCGENGAGKSTLLKVLSGVYPHGSYEGRVLVDGEEQMFSSTAAARASGVGIVHQELMLVPEMTVAENLLLGREPRRFGLVDRDMVEKRARELLARYGFADEIEATRPVGELGIGLQQVVEIVRALSDDARILVLDEPTAALTQRESDRLMEWLRGLREAGTTCIYVSHRLDEVFEICDRITVLRDGRTVGSLITKETSADEVVALMVGRAVSIGAPKTPGHHDEVALDVRGLKLGRAIDGVSLKVHAGEIVALAGAMGSGRTAVLATLFGLARGEVAGDVRISGVEGVPASPSEAIARRVALLPEDRKGLGLVLEMTVAENLALPALAAHAELADDAHAEKLAHKRIAELRIRGSAESPVGTLSGGNQQKVVLGKWLEDEPRVLLLDEPTRGVDIGAREEIYGIIERLAREGAAVLFASSDLAEIVRLAERVIVLRQGRVEGELVGAAITQPAIVSLSTGAAAA